MRTYDTYKDSGISWLGHIPSHWELKPGFSLYHENDEKFDMLSEPTVLSLSYGNIIVKKNKDEGLVPENYSGYQVIKPDYIIIRCTDLQNDKVSLRTGIAKNHGIITGAYLGLIAKDGFNAQYLHYFLHDWDITKEIYRHGSGLRQVLSWNDMKRLPILVPPLAEQEAIVAYLDSATAEIDKAIASQQRMVELLQERKQIIINQAVTQGLNPDAPMKPTNIDWLPQIPAHWDVKMFKHLYRTRTGITFTKAQLEDKGERVISYGQIHSKLNWYSSVNPELIRYIPESLTCGCDGALAYKGDFLFADTSEDFEGCGNCIYVDTEEPIYAGYHTILAKKNNEEHGEYLAFLFASTNWRGQVRSAVNGVKVYSITQTILNNTSVILPPVNEQKQIADYIQSAIKPIDAEITRCQHKVELLTERKQILINDVVTGKINIMY